MKNRKNLLACLFGTFPMIYLVLTNANAVMNPPPDGTLLFAAFECHHLARFAENENEAKRLLGIGSSAGQAVMTEYNKLPDSEKYFEISTGEGLLYQIPVGLPSDEFVLGMIYEHARRGVWDKIIIDDNGEHIYGDKFKNAAEFEYGHKNCKLIN